MLGTGAFVAAVALVLWAKASGVLEAAVPWIIGGFAVFVVFGLAGHFLRMAFQSIRRGILNQHVLLEFGAFAGLVGGVLGLILRRPDYPTAPFFAVAVLIVNYHLFSEWQPCVEVGGERAKKGQGAIAASGSREMIAAHRTLLDANVLFQVVNDHHLHRRPLVFTTDKPLRAWGRVLHDPDLAEAYLERRAFAFRLPRMRQ